MQKRGISHIEAILSFILFIGFVFIGLYFFLPSGNYNLIDSSLQYTLNEIEKNSSVEIMSFSIKVHNENVPDEQETIAVEFPPEILAIPSNYVVRVENYDGQKLPATRQGDRVYLDHQENDFVLIKFSEDFSSSSPATQIVELDPTMYTVASSTSKIVISEKRLKEMNSSYYSDYSNLKKEFNIPGQITFGYMISLGEYNLIAPLEVPAGVDVYSAISRKEILKEDGKTLFGEIGVRIW